MFCFFIALSFSSGLDDFFTVILSNGRKKTEINTFSDAVDHGRFGSGEAIPAGPSLLRDILNNQEFINFYNDTNGIILTRLESNLNGITKANKEGNFSLPVASEQIQCENSILHRFNISYGYNMKYQCVDISFSDMRCTIDATVSYFGESEFEYKRYDDISSLQNTLDNTLPLFLIKWRGNFKPYNITYNYDMTINHVFDIAVFE